MATVRQLGYFPWCPWSSSKAFKDFLGYDLYPEGTFDLTSMNSLVFPTVQAALAAYWRVKKWRVTGQTWYAMSDNDAALIVLNNIIDRGLISERQLFCLGDKNNPPAFEPFSATYFGNTLNFSFQFPKVLIGGVPPTIGATDWFTYCEINGPEEGNWPAIATSDNALLPPQERPIPFYIPIRFLEWRGDDPENSIVMKTMIADAETPTAIENDPNWDGSVHIEITAVEYWEYDPGDGSGPIYDKWTGSQLRPFP